VQIPLPNSLVHPWLLARPPPVPLYAPAILKFFPVAVVKEAQSS